MAAHDVPLTEDEHQWLLADEARWRRATEIG